jgi:acyl-CoA thioester hydrolase
MPKPDPALLDPARYPFSCSVETRFGDLDTNLHINNVALCQMLEEGRVRYHRLAKNSGREMQTAPMVVSLAIEFVGQTYYPDPLEVYVAVGPIGRTSYLLYELVTQQGRAVVFATTTVVCTDNGAKAEIPPRLRESLEAWRLRS